jgi:dTDP-4-dehydrorhamnose reductase
MDLCDPDSVRAAFEYARPDITIHTAAIADIDACERNPDLAWKTNSDGTRLVCRGVQEQGSRLVHISTSNVFDGKRGNYLETDPTGGINVYAESKISAEREAQKVDGSMVIRNPIVLGFPIISGRSFLLRTVTDLEEARSITLPIREIKTPIDSWTLSMCILELVRSGCEGIYHVAGTEALSRYEMGLRIAEKLGCDPSLVIPLVNPPPERAPRPLNATLNTAKAGSILKLDLPDCREAIERAFRFAGRFPT